MKSIEEKFESMEVVDMRDTVEYKEDTFGLRTLDERGGLFRYSPANVHHVCWLTDFALPNGEKMCKFHEVYDKYIYKALS
ncbi:hypothetical protein DVH05_001513 [Phytophthora capsici]|nr:hypothetical protein DVH05_001513 [Phytophthora capsici]